MLSVTTYRPQTGEPLLTPTSQGVRSRVFAVAAAIGALIDTGASKRHPLLAEAIIMPFANMALIGTNCARPLKLEESEIIAHETGLDIVLLRFDRLDHQSIYWRCNHVAWRRHGGDLWLIPEVSRECFIRTGAWGLEYETEPPFVSEGERHAGTIRALGNPSFEGRI